MTATSRPERVGEYHENLVDVGGSGVVLLEGGTGPGLLVLHDELGFPGWMRWNRQISKQSRLIIPLQPGFGRTPRVKWLRSYRDVASLYLRMVREQGWGPINVIGFSAGGFIAAEMAAACPEAIRKMILVAPMGVRPTEGQIFDFLAVTMRTHIATTITREEAPEAREIYSGDMTPHQFELFEAARAETSRLGWEPFMYDYNLPERLEGIGGIETLLIWGDHDKILPRSCIEVYQKAIPRSEVVIIAGVGHRPEIEDPDSLVCALTGFIEN